MRLLNDEELYEVEHEWLFQWGQVPDEYKLDIAKAQQELTNKEWVEWFEQYRARDDSNGQLWYCISDPHWQARLKEIGNEPQV